MINSGIHLIFLTPGYIGTVAWIQLLGRSGYLTRWARANLGILRPPVNLYTLKATTVIMGLYLMPLVYMATRNALRNTDPTLEEAAIAAGAAPTQVIFTVTLPLALPSVLSGALLVFVHGISGFGIPAALALPAGYLVLTTQIYSALGHYDVRKACALAVMLASIMAVTMLIYHVLLRINRHTVTNASDLRQRTLHLGRWGYIVTGVCLLCLILVAIAPLATILMTSMLKAWGLPLIPTNLTFNNYASIFSVELTGRAFRNSFAYAVISATGTTLLGFVVAYMSIRTRRPGGRFLDFLATMPSAIPSPVLAAAMIFAWMLPPLKLYNTPWIIIVAYVTAFLPYTVRNIAGALRTLHPQLEEMGWMCGGAWLTVLRDVVIPCIKGSLWTSWMVVSLMAFREIPLSTMLYTKGTETVGVLLFLLKTEAGGLEVTSAVAVVVMALTVIGQTVVRRAIQRQTNTAAMA
jgi:iron(III) transport system permease protein